MIERKTECPDDDFSCPYYEDGYCTLEHPEEDCDAFADLIDEDFDEEGYFLCWEVE